MSTHIPKTVTVASVGETVWWLDYKRYDLSMTTDPVVAMFPLSTNWPEWKRVLAKRMILMGSNKMQINRVFKAMRRIKQRCK